MNFYQELGPLVLGTRLKRLSDYFLSEINKVYSDRGIPFEASWFGVFYLLDKHESLSIFEISEKLEVSHSAISQLVKTLVKLKHVKLTNSKMDGRRKDITLTEQGVALLIQIKPVWIALDKAMQKRLTNNELLNNLLALENEFLKHDLNHSIKSELDV